MESQRKSSSQCVDFSIKSSWSLSVLSMLLTIVLFLRMETINNKTDMNEMRISKVESHMKSATLQSLMDNDKVISSQGKHAPLLAF